MSEWREYRLGDIYDVHNGLSKGGKFFGSGYPFLTFSEVFNNYFIPSKLSSLVQSTDRERLVCNILAGDIFVTRTSETANELGMSCVALKDYPNATYNGFTKRLRKKENCKVDVDSRFIGYFLRSRKFRSLFYGISGGMSTRASLANNDLLNMVITLPSFPEQKKIGEILKYFDDKIAVNRRICENLEAQTQALFKHWFIDFAPFKNGKFVESELGMIPEGWRVVTLDEATSKFGTGLNPRKNFKLGFGNNYYVTIKNMIDNRVVLDNKCDFVDDEAIKVIQKRSKLSKGDLLFSGIGTIGRVAIVVDEPFNWNTSESVFNMHPAEEFSTEFLYVLLLSKPLQNYVKINSQGAVQQGIRMASLKAYKFPYPKYVMKEFNGILKDIISKKIIMEKECDALSTLRDTLLPKLMSGQIKV